MTISYVIGACIAGKATEILLRSGGTSRPIAHAIAGLMVIGVLVQAATR